MAENSRNRLFGTSHPLPLASHIEFLTLTAPAGRCTKTLWREVRDN